MTEQAMNILLIAVNVVQSVLICDFSVRFMGATRKAYYYLLMVLIFVVVNVLMLSGEWPVPLRYLPLAVLLLLFYLFALKRTVVQSVTGTVLVLTVASVLENINFSLLMLVGNLIRIEIMQVVNVVDIIAFVFISQLMLRYIANKFSFVREEHFPDFYTLWLPLIMIFIFSEAFFWATSGTITTVDADGYGHIQSRLGVPIWWGLPFFLFALVCIIVLFFSYQKFLSFYARRQRALNLEQVLNWQKTAIDETMLRYDSTKAFRHDLNNQMGVLHGLIRDRKLEEAEDYLEQITGFAGSLSSEIQSGNSVLDVLLNEKTAAAKRTNIQISCQADIGKTAVNDYDLCVLAGNAFDNAIKACEGVPDGKKYIDMEILRKKDFLYLKMKNSKGGDVRKGQGYGLRNMRAIAEKYNGSMETSDHPDSFEVIAILAIPLAD